MLAAWILDYDHVTDTCYNRPGCIECQAPVDKMEDGKYHCFSCGKVVNVKDPEMIRWLDEMGQTKTERRDCLRCGGKDSLEIVYYKNPVSREWQMGHGECSKCGMRFIV